MRVLPLARQLGRLCLLGLLALLMLALPWRAGSAAGMGASGHVHGHTASAHSSLPCLVATGGAPPSIADAHHGAHCAEGKLAASSACGGASCCGPLAAPCPGLALCAGLVVPEALCTAPASPLAGRTVAPDHRPPIG